MADREETAAHKRECGNAAKLREALQQAKVAILAAKEKMGVENPIILEIIDAALAAPPRNCDRPECATLETATRTWIQEVFGPYCNGKATTDDIRTFDVWIYAPATEQEGGAK